MHRLREMLKAVVVAGIKDVSRAIITQKDESEKTPAERAHGGPCYLLLVEGAGLQASRPDPAAYPASVPAPSNVGPCCIRGNVCRPYPDCAYTGGDGR